MQVSNNEPVSGVGDTALEVEDTKDSHKMRRNTSWNNFASRLFEVRRSLRVFTSLVRRNALNRMRVYRCENRSR